METPAAKASAGLLYGEHSMEFMALYILTLFIVILGLSLAVLFVCLGIKGIGYVMDIWLHPPGSDGEGKGNDIS